MKSLEVEALSEEELLQLSQDLSILETESRRNPIAYYCPNHIGQGPFHLSSARTRILLGGNRSGKTTAGSCEAIAHALGVRPWLKEDDPGYLVRLAGGRKIPVPNTGTVCGESYKISVDRVLWPTLSEWFPKDFIRNAVKNQQGVVDTVEFTNGSRIRFMTYNQQPKEFEGFKAHWAWYDEPPPHGIYISNERSLVDYGGRSWFTLTPVRQPWIWSELVSQEGEDPTIEVFRMSIWDNARENGGYLEREFIEYYLSKLPEEERKSRETGEFLHLQGRVFPEWLPKRPFWIPYEQMKLKTHWPRVMAIDPHPRKPVACLWVAISPDTDLWYAYRELYDPKLKTVHELSEKIYELERGEPVPFRIIDPSSQENERTADSSVFETFADHGIFCELAQRSDKDGRRKKLKEKLRLDSVYQVPGLITLAPPLGSPSNHDRSRGDGGCPRLRYEFLNHVWDEWSPAARDRHDPKPEPLKKDDDLLDGLMYLCQYGDEARDFDPRFWNYAEGKLEELEERQGVVLPEGRRSRTGY